MPAPETPPWREASRAIAADLARSTDASTARVGRAVLATLAADGTEVERAAMARIEGLRAQVIQSEERVTIEDFGAVSPTAHLSDADMYAGRVAAKTVGQVCREASKASPWTLLLFHLVRQFAPARAIELGCSLGISASYQAAAQRLNRHGRFWTLEGARALADLARQHLAELGLDHVTVVTGRFQDTLDDVIAAARPIDYAFIDGHHDERATLRYFEHLLPHLDRVAVLVFDDISWSAGMARAWQQIDADPRVGLAVDAHHVGICVLDPATPRRRVQIRLR
jgi:predicted O-methyltransferase YrrM